MAQADNNEKTEADIEQEQWEADVREVLGTPAGRRLAGRLMRYAGVMQRSPFAGSGAAEGTAYNCGRREPLEWLWREAGRICPEARRAIDF